MEASSPMKSPVVYLYGYVEDQTMMWYTIDLDLLNLRPSPVTTDTGKGKNLPVVIDDLQSFELKSESRGSWTIVGDHIYYAGGVRDTGPLEGRVSGDLLKYNPASASPGWEVVSSSRLLPRAYPSVFAPIGKKLYVLGGTKDDYGDPNLYSEDEEEVELDDEFLDDLPRDWTNWGEIFDLELKTWKPLELNVRKYCDYHKIYSAIVEKQGEPTRIVLYSLISGRMMFYNVSKDDDEPPRVERFPSFALLEPKDTPKGLETCEDISYLQKSAFMSPPLVNNSTFYWFADDLHLYGYDLVHRRWFRSQSLEKELWTLGHLRGMKYNEPPALVDLRNGRFLMFVKYADGKLAMVSFAVFKDRDSLRVEVESHHSLLVNDKFLPRDGKLMQWGQHIVDDVQEALPEESLEEVGSSFPNVDEGIPANADGVPEAGPPSTEAVHKERMLKHLHDELVEIHATERKLKKAKTNILGLIADLQGSKS